jgi:quercetin dioxygenase-like cupin family protein
MTAEKNNPASGPAKQRPAVRLAVREKPIDITVETARLKQDEAWKKGQHSARTLLNQPELGLVLLAFKAGGSLAEHRYDGSFTLHTLSGAVRLRMPHASIDLAAGQLSVVGPGIVHDVEAIEESTCLLTLVKP